MNIHPAINDEVDQLQDQEEDLNQLDEPLAPDENAAVAVPVANAPHLLPPRPAADAPRMRRLFLCSPDDIRNGNYESSIGPLKKRKSK